MNLRITRRRFLTTAGAAVAAASLDRSRPLWAQTTASTPPAQTPTWTPVFTPVRRNIGYFTGRGGTIGYLINADGVLVVDSQYPDSAKAFLEGLAERTNHRPVDVLVNTHHHADHTGGNPAFKGVTKTIVAQTRVPALQKQANDVSTTPAEQVYADATFDELWNHVVGDERVHARTFTPAHTGGDIVVYFERANVVHVGDLVWNGLQTFVDRPGGASAVNWIPVCERIASTYPKDAIYLCGHAKKDLSVALAQADVLAMRDYLTALVEHVRHEMAAGKSRDEIVSSTAPLAGFEARGPLTKRALEGTYDELASR
jgi:cyclase